MQRPDYRPACTPGRQWSSAARIRVHTAAELETSWSVFCSLCVCVCVCVCVFRCACMYASVYAHSRTPTHTYTHTHTHTLHLLNQNQTSDLRRSLQSRRQTPFRIPSARRHGSCSHSNQWCLSFFLEQILQSQSISIFTI